MKPEGFSSENRDELAEQLRNAPKDERKDLLESARDNPLYWMERSRHLSAVAPYTPDKAQQAYSEDEARAYGNIQKEKYHQAKKYRNVTSVHAS